MWEASLDEESGEEAGWMEWVPAWSRGLREESEELDRVVTWKTGERETEREEKEKEEETSQGREWMWK